jgi:GntR family transcriptional regulator
VTTRWEDVRDTLSQHIADGRWPLGERVPPEIELAASLGVSRATLREALRALHLEGLITRTRGAGTRVARRPRLSNNLVVNFGVSDLIRSTGMSPGTRNLSISDALPSAEEARALGLDKSDCVVVAERVRTADGRPVVFSRDVYPLAVLPGGSEDLQRLDGISIYDFLEQYCGIQVDHGIARIQPALTDPHLSGLLAVPEQTLLMCLDQTDYDTSGRPVLHSLEFHLADAFEFSVVRRGGRFTTPKPGTHPPTPAAQRTNG